MLENNSAAFAHKTETYSDLPGISLETNTISWAPPDASVAVSSPAPVSAVFLASPSCVPPSAFASYCVCKPWN